MAIGLLHFFYSVNRQIAEFMITKGWISSQKKSAGFSRKISIEALNLGYYF
jgi:hypothetical protein